SDPGILQLLRLWLSADVIEENRRFRLKKGVPQGSPISPLLANLYLDRLDEALLDENLCMIRFADDFLILCRHKEAATKALEFTAEVLASLCLRLSPQKTRIVDFNHGFRFLGVEFVRSLILKAQYPEAAPLSPDLETLAHLPAHLPEPVEQEDLPDDKKQQPSRSKKNKAVRGKRSLTEMALALAEAGIDPADFPQQTEQPDQFEETEQVMPVEPPVKAAKKATPAELDPRLRTLYVLENGYVLGKESERFIIKKRGEILQRIPAIKVDQIMIFGNAQISTQVMHFCLQAKIPIYLLSGQGRFHGVVDGFSTDPVLLHRDQFQRAEEIPFCLELAREWVRGKIANCRVILLRYGRNRNLPALSQAAERLGLILRKVQDAHNLDSLRGYEGTAARTYFAALAAVFDPDWQFTGRTRQPPTDPVNALLSYGYTLLFYNLYSFLRARGLNPHVGFFHQVRSGHPALVSDMMEEFRAIIVDIVVLKLVLNRHLTPKEFTMPTGANTACLMSDQARKLFIRELEKKLNAAILHPVSGLHLDYRRCLEHQVHHLAAVIQKREARY
ncbi:MAG: CRISPR-associated endonuclease Cas1, partial [Candidatus Electrothrix sp. AR3]|nr:CRISPR-associated endonuclease Cas1 [Candidatus Electrothrix sp. AR3]